jgi:hypothetical protein
MNRSVLLTALLVYLLISFMPSLALPNLMGKGKKG